jgi:signal transduction histidine kinase
MNDRTPIPHDKLERMRESIGLDEQALSVLEPHREKLRARAGDFARHLYDTFMAMPETRRYLENEAVPGRMLAIWTHWFKTVLAATGSRELVDYLWRVGLRHVEVGLDQSYSNLGFAVAKKYCQELVKDAVPDEEAARVAGVVDRLLEYCLLVETSAYVETSTRCDIEIMRGIADRLRNPVTIIGGNVHRLMKHAASAGDTEGLETVLGEVRRLERLMGDIKTYVGMFETEPLFRKIPLEAALERAISSLGELARQRGVSVEAAVADDARWVKGDPANVEHILFYVLENAVEAASGEEPLVRVLAAGSSEPCPCVEVEFFNTGTAPSPEETERMLLPFYSTKPEGTGFGLPIVILAVRRGLGRLRMEPAAGGTRVVVTLPVAT